MGLATKQTNLVSETGFRTFKFELRHSGNIGILNLPCAIQGWRQHLEYSKEQKREEERVEREAQVVAEDTMPLEAGLDGALTCPFCRLACSKAANLKRHR